MQAGRPRASLPDARIALNPPTCRTAREPPWKRNKDRDINCFSSAGGDAKVRPRTAGMAMYRYDSFDREFVAERVRHYRAQTDRYLAGELSEDEFRHLR